ncbi:hypothetical protein DFP73DRAFT_620925 [Morchella snyderi]|nr:hypothetical protein DFP73DRAFT_620925 [Morchella snyderi]
MSAAADPHDRSDITGTNRLAPPPQETRGATFTKTSTRERTFISTFTSFAALPQPTDDSGGGFNPPPAQSITTVSLIPPPQSTAAATEVVVVVSAPEFKPTPTTSIFMRPGSTIPMLSTPSAATFTSSISGPSNIVTKTSSTEIRLHIATTTPIPASGGSGGTKLSPNLIAGVSAGATAAIVAAIVLFICFRVRRKNRASVSNKTMLKREIGKPVVISTSNEAGGSAETFFKGTGEAGSEKSMLSAHESEAMMLSRNTSPTTQALGYAYERPSSFPSSNGAGVNNAGPPPVLRAPETSAKSSPTFAPNRGYYGSIPIVIEPPTPVAATPPPPRPVRPPSSFYPPNGDNIEPYATRRLDDPLNNYPARAYIDAGNPYAMKPATRMVLNVPKSSHQSERVPSVLSGAGSTPETPDSASYYSVGYMHEYLKGGVRGSRMTTLSEDEPNGFLMGSILEQCESAPRPHVRPPEEAVVEEWYGNDGRNLVGRGGV